MMKKHLAVIALAVLLLCVNGEHLIKGVSNKRTLIHHTVLQFNGIPFVRRVKNYFYNDPGQNVINSLLIYDNLYSRATATVTAGGIGFTYVNLQFVSKRGEGLDYDIGIYA